MIFTLRFILTTIIIFFLWNILKRLFSSYLYRNTPKQESKFPKTKKNGKNFSSTSKIKWDAETVDYEEIEEDSGKKE